MGKILKNRLVIFMFFILVFLAIVAVVVVINKSDKGNEKAEIKYVITNAQVKNNKLIVKVMAAVFKGKNVDPFTYVRLVDSLWIPYYPLNGFAKLSLNKGDSLEIAFEFNASKTPDNILEIKDSSNNKVYINLTFPELVNQT